MSQKQVPCTETTSYILKKMPCHIHDVLLERKTELTLKRRRSVTIAEANYDIIKEWKELKQKQAA